MKQKQNICFVKKTINNLRTKYFISIKIFVSKANKTLYNYTINISVALALNGVASANGDKLPWLRQLVY